MSKDIKFPKLGGGWNYRMAKRTVNGQIEFLIIEVLYDEDGNANGYADDVNPLSGWETLEDLVGTIDFVKLTVSKPVIDLDSFPDEWPIVLPG